VTRIRAPLTTTQSSSSARIPKRPIVELLVSLGVMCIITCSELGIINITSVMNRLVRVFYQIINGISLIWLGRYQRIYKFFVKVYVSP
jgi:hypothetical protein